MAKAGMWVSVYLDDFVGICLAADAEKEVAFLRGVLAMFGLVESVKKFVPPGDDVEVLGVRYVVSEGKAMVSERRATELLRQLGVVLDGRPKTVPAAALRKLSGVLSFVAATVPWGRAHISPIWQVLGRVRRPDHHCNITAAVRDACVWWRNVLLGTAFRVTPFDVGTRPERPLYIVVGVRCDASTEWGWGMVSDSQAVFARGAWSPEEQLLGIVVLEGLAVLYTLVCLGDSLRGTQVLLQSDNAGVVFMMLREHSRDERLCALLQAIVHQQEQHRYRVVVGHTSTKFMGETDDMSRGVEPSQCLPPRPGGWSECETWRAVQRLSCSALRSSPPGTSLGHEAAVRAWVSSISGWARTSVESVASAWTTPVPFVPFRTWAVVLNDRVHRLSAQLC
jgi:hypothetical protein